jgi:hypothetical protein
VLLREAGHRGRRCAGRWPRDFALFARRALGDIGNQHRQAARRGEVLFVFSGFRREAQRNQLVADAVGEGEAEG